MRVVPGAVLRAHLDRQPAANLQGGVRHGLLQPVGAFQEMPLHQHRLLLVYNNLILTSLKAFSRFFHCFRPDAVGCKGSDDPFPYLS